MCVLRALQLAQAVVDAGAVAYLAPLIQHDDGKLKRQVCSCLAQIAKHSVDLAEVVVEAEIFPKILTCLGDVDTYVRKNAAARKAFMQTGLLQRVQELRLSAGPKVAESISRINAAFPTECVKFSDPSYARELVAKLEA